jgi:hypothetical protein
VLPEISLNVDCLMALVRQLQIVSVGWLDACQAEMQKTCTLPSVDTFVPPVKDERLQGCVRVADRTTFLRGNTFLVSSSDQFKAYHTLLDAAGAKAIQLAPMDSCEAVVAQYFEHEHAALVMPPNPADGVLNVLAQACSVLDQPLVSQEAILLSIALLSKEPLTQATLTIVPDVPTQPLFEIDSQVRPTRKAKKKIPRIARLFLLHNSV